MTTKEQEKKALEKIRKIVEELGEDSYIGMAFTGCFNDAETNIENDWALSMYDRWQSAEQKLEHEKAIAEEVGRAGDEAQKECDEWRSRWEKKCDEVKEWNESWTKVWNNFRAQEDRANALELENIKLKAKLYDLITSE